LSSNVPFTIQKKMYPIFCSVVLALLVPTVALARAVPVVGLTLVAPTVDFALENG